MQRIINNEFKDGMIFMDEAKSNKVIFNGYTFIEIIKGIIVKYANKTIDNASVIVLNSKYLATPIIDYNDVVFFSHETEYHWAMLMVYGELYWKKGISSILPLDYGKWEEEYILEHGLAANSFEFL